MDFLRGLTDQIGGSAALVAAFGALITLYLKYYFDRRVEQLKQQIKSDSDQTIKKLESKLLRQSSEYQTRFSKWHDLHIETLITLYSGLATAIRDADQYVGIEDRLVPALTVEDRSARAVESFRKLEDLFNQRRILVPGELAERTDDLLKEVRRALSDFKFSSEMYTPNAQQFLPETKAQLRNEQAKAWSTVQRSARSLRNDMEARFRSLLEVPRDTES